MDTEIEVAVAVEADSGRGWNITPAVLSRLRLQVRAAGGATKDAEKKADLAELDTAECRASKSAGES